MHALNAQQSADILQCRATKAALLLQHTFASVTLHYSAPSVDIVATVQWVVQKTHLKLCTTEGLNTAGGRGWLVQTSRAAESLLIGNAAADY